MRPLRSSLVPPKAPSLARIAVHAPPSTLTCAEATPLASAAVEVTVTVAPKAAGLGKRTGVVTVGGLVSAAALTLRMVLPLTAPNVALMLLVPALRPWARPLALMV